MQDAIIMYENGKAIGGEGHPTNASDITFDNTGTDLVSEEVESAIKEVNGKSAKSADLTSISESGTTASQAISVGTYFYLNGTLVRAKTDIANGATFTLNTNYEVVSAGALNSLTPSVPNGVYEISQALGIHQGSHYQTFVIYGNFKDKTVTLNEVKIYKCDGTWNTDDVTSKSSISAQSAVGITLIINNIATSDNKVVYVKFTVS